MVLVNLVELIVFLWLAFILVVWARAYRRPTPYTDPVPTSRLTWVQVVLYGTALMAIVGVGLTAYELILYLY